MLLTLQLLCCGRVRNLSGSSLLGGKPQVEHFKVRITSVSLHRLPLMTISIINIMSRKCSQLAFSVFSVNGKIKEILNETKQQIINKLLVKMFRSHAKLINWLTISALAIIGITNISCAVLMCCDHWAGRVKLRYKIFAMIFQQRSFPMFDYRRVWTDERRDPGARSSIATYAGHLVEGRGTRISAIIHSSSLNPVRSCILHAACMERAHRWPVRMRTHKMFSICNRVVLAEPQYWQAVLCCNC